MNKPPPTTIFPSYPKDLDPGLRRTLQHVWDRVNFLIDAVGVPQPGAIAPAGDLSSQVNKLQVVLQTVQDSITSQSTFVGFGASAPVAPTAFVSFTASGVGLAISGPSNGATITVTSAASVRSAISAALKGSPGAHTITLAAITGGGTQGSISWNADGCVTAFVDPT